MIVIEKDGETWIFANRGHEQQIRELIGSPKFTAKIGDTKPVEVNGYTVQWQSPEDMRDRINRGRKRRTEPFKDIGLRLPMRLFEQYEAMYSNPEARNRAMIWAIEQGLK